MDNGPTWHPRKCCVANCDDLFSKRHRFPKKDPEIYQLWINNVRPTNFENLTTEQIYMRYYVCDKHFTGDCFVVGTRRGLTRIAVPTLHIPGLRDTANPCKRQKLDEVIGLRDTANPCKRQKLDEDIAIPSHHLQHEGEDTTKKSSARLSEKVVVQPTSTSTMLIGASNIEEENSVASPINLRCDEEFTLTEDESSAGDPGNILEQPSSSTRIIEASYRQDKNSVGTARSGNSLSYTTDKGMPSTVQDNNYRALLQNYVRVQKEKEKLRGKNEKLIKKLQDNQRRFVALRSKNLQLTNTVKKYQEYFDLNVKKYVSNFLTPNQQKLVLKKQKKVRWTSDEISKAFTLRYMCKQAYIYVREKLMYPLPALSTLERWASNIQVRNELLVNVLQIMEICGKNKSKVHRITVISFAEMEVSATYEYDQKADQVVGEHKHMQIVMARGLFDDWKQPVYVAFDKKMTVVLLDDILSELFKIGYNVVACVYNCGGYNTELWSELDIHVNKTYFFHPITNEKVYFFADACHLLKLIRNSFVDAGFNFGDGTLISAEPVKDLITMDIEANSSVKLTSVHLTRDSMQQQNITLATQLFSSSTATALRRYLPGPDKKLTRNVADFIELIQQWFDIFNTYTLDSDVPTRIPFGLNLETQSEILKKMENTFKTVCCNPKNVLQGFQKDVIISINSLQNLYEDVKNTYGISYILTHRLRQDDLENLFSQIRTRNEDKPTPLNALCRLRMILLGRDDGNIQKNTNVSVRKSEEYILNSALRKAQIKKVIHSPTVVSENLLEEDMSNTSIITITGQTEKDALENIAKYVANKFLNQYPNLSYTDYNEPEDMQLLSGDLVKPSPAWLQNVFRLETHFNQFHKKLFRPGKDIVKKTSNYLSGKVKDVPQDVIREFSKQRILVRIKYLNCRKKSDFQCK